MNKQLKLFTISVGNRRFSVWKCKNNIAMFKSNRLNLEGYIVMADIHGWTVKLYLAQTLQQLFK